MRFLVRPAEQTWNGSDQRSPRTPVKSGSIGPSPMLQWTSGPISVGSSRRASADPRDGGQLGLYSRPTTLLRGATNADVVSDAFGNRSRARSEPHSAFGELWWPRSFEGRPITSRCHASRRAADVRSMSRTLRRFRSRLVMLSVDVTSAESCYGSSRIASSRSWTVTGRAHRGREKGVWGVERACHTGQHRSLQSVCVTQENKADLGSRV